MRTLAAATAAVGLLLGAPGPALAQPMAQAPRGDVAGYIAWTAIENVPPEPEFLRHGWEDLFSAGLAAGWYFTDHWKAEIDVSGTSTGETFYSRPIIVDDFHHFQAVQSSLERRTVGLGVQYQFFRNAWFHPFAGGGALMTWERRTDRYEPVLDFRAGPTPRVLRDGRFEGPVTNWTASPFLVAGVKAYMTRRAFFRGDLRLAFGDGLDQSALGAGFGIDF